MPAHSVLISPAQGLPACATATEPDSSSAVSITSPDCIPAILDSTTRSKKAYRGISESQLRRYSGGAAGTVLVLAAPFIVWCLVRRQAQHVEIGRGPLPGRW